MIFKCIKLILIKLQLYYKNCIFNVIILSSLFFSGNCSILWCKCTNNITSNKKFPFTDFCGCGPTCQNTDSDSILEKNDFPADDEENVNYDL